jgi:HSP20 family molecular chaperone IbpA
MGEEKKHRRPSSPLGMLGHLQRASASSGSATWRPLADIYKVRGGWIVKFELAGVAPEDVHIYAQKRRLTVSGVRRDMVHEETCSHYLMEISYNRFERNVELPFDFDAKNLLVEYRNGLLLVRITEEGPGCEGDDL